MWLSRTPLSIVILICLSVIYLLFSVKNGVMSMRSELSELTRQIKQEKEAIKILKAEFAYLTAPARLKRLNDQYFKLQETVANQIIANPSLDSNIKDKLLATKYYRKNSVKNWRYRKSKSKYLTLATNK